MTPHHFFRSILHRAAAAFASASPSSYSGHGKKSVRGFTLLTSIILSSVVLSLGIALLDVSYKQTILSSSGKNSQYAFYAADSGMECALYWDNKQNAFDYAGLPSNTISCSNQAINLTTAPNSSTVNGTTRTTTFSIPCPGSASYAQSRIVIAKTNANATNIYVTGYSSCDPNDPRRIERGLKTNY